MDDVTEPCVTSRTCPAGVTDALVGEEAVHAEAVLAGVSGTQVYFPLTALPGETCHGGGGARLIVMGITEGETIHSMVQMKRMISQLPE